MRTPKIASGICLAVLAAICLPVWVTAQAPKSDAKESADVAYARTFLALTQLDLQRANDMNKRVPGTYSNETLGTLRRTVASAQGWLDSQLSKDDGTPVVNPIVAICETRAKIAQEEYQREVAFSERAPAAADPNTLARTRLMAELSKLRVERAKALNITSPDDLLRWELDQLREDVLLLSQEVARITIRL